MKRLLPACGLFGALLLVCGCGSSKPEVPSWFKGDGTKGNPVAKNSPDQLHKDLSRKIKLLEHKVAALDEAIASVKKSKANHIANLRKHGVRSVEDLNKPQFKDDNEVQRMKDLLVKNQQELAKYEQMHKQYSLTLLDGKEALDSLDRQLKLARAGITEKELEDLAVMIKKIDERLSNAEPGNVADPIKGETDLDKILKGDN